MDTSKVEVLVPSVPQFSSRRSHRLLHFSELKEDKKPHQSQITAELSLCNLRENESYTLFEVFKTKVAKDLSKLILQLALLDQEGQFQPEEVCGPL